MAHFSRRKVVLSPTYYRRFGPVAVVGAVVVVGGAVLVVVGGLLTWTVSGEVSRSGFESVRAADRLGLLESGPSSVLAIAWYCTPLLGALVVLGAVRRWHRRLVMLSAADGVIAIATAVIALDSDIASGPGPFVTLVGGTFLVLGALMVLREQALMVLLEKGSTGDEDATNEKNIEGLVTQTGTRRCLTHDDGARDD